MFEATIDRNDIEKIKEFVESGNLTGIMIEYGLEFTQMAFILDAIYTRIDKVEAILNGEE